MHHISCGRGTPLGARIFRRRFQGHMECHCVVIAGSDRVVLIDAGLSRRELENPRRLGPFAKALGLHRDPERAAIEQLPRLGVDPAAVTDVVLTHLDLDHAGGVADFPRARVHVHARELEAARNPRTRSERMRYRPEQWTDASFVSHTKTQPILEPAGWSIALVPLFGHTRGHCGVSIERDGERMLHCGDAYYDRSECELPTSFSYECFRRLIHENRAAAAESLGRLQALEARDPSLRVFCAHDPGEFAREATRG